MPKIKFPQKDIWKGQFAGERFGDFIQSFNIDLERNLGTIHISERLRTVFDSASDADLGVPVSFLLTNADGTNRYWTLAGNDLFNSDAGNPEAGWAQDTGVGGDGVPTTCDSDGHLIEYANNMYVPIASNNIAELSGNSWNNNWFQSQSGASALSNFKRIMEISSVGHLLISNGRFVASFDGSVVVMEKLTLPSEYEVTDMRRTDTFTAIASKTIDGDDAKIFHWDGTSDTYNSYYSAGTNEVVSIFIADGIPHIITKSGQLKRFTGSEYAEIQDSSGVELNFPSHKNNGTVFVAHDGIAPIDGKTAIMIKNAVPVAGTPADEADGIWMYDPQTLTLNHKYSLSRQPHGSGGTKDFGHRGIVNEGGILQTAIGSGKLLAGGAVYNNYSSTNLKVICTSMESNTADARGYLITPKMESGDVAGFFKKLQPIFRKFVNSTDKIIVKYRISESTTLPLVKAATMASGTTFTVSSASGLAEGDEVEFIAGKNAGLIAHITNITGTTITIDETALETSDGALVIFYNWTKQETLNTQSIQNKIIGIAKRSSWIQFKLELRGDEVSPELQKIFLDFNAKTK